jgi:hypothetical protein
LRLEAEELLAESRIRVLEHHPGVTTSIREGNPANENPERGRSRRL